MIPFSTPPRLGRTRDFIELLGNAAAYQARGMGQGLCYSPRADGNVLEIGGLQDTQVASETGNCKTGRPGILLGGYTG